jgi:hypothetical protein
MIEQTAMQIMYDELIAHEYTIPLSLIVKCKELLELEKIQHGNSWDSGIDAHEKRAYNISRSHVDFDDYFIETYGK